MKGEREKEKRGLRLEEGECREGGYIQGKAERKKSKKERMRGRGWVVVPKTVAVVSRLLATRKLFEVSNSRMCMRVGGVRGICSYKYGIMIIARALGEDVVCGGPHHATLPYRTHYDDTLCVRVGRKGEVGR